MTKNHHDSTRRGPSKDDLFAGFGPPELPEGLGHRVLARARLAAGRVPKPWVDRLWESRPLWVAWAAGVVLLLTAQIWLARPYAGGMAVERATREAPLTGIDPTPNGANDFGVCCEAEWEPLLARHPIRQERTLSSSGLRPTVSIAVDSLL